MLVIMVGLFNLALVRWSRFLDRATDGKARLKLIWSVMAFTWLFSLIAATLPGLGWVSFEGHVGFELVCVTGTAPVVYWLLRLQIGLWANKIDL